MAVPARVRAWGHEARTMASDAARFVPLAAYRLSGRRWAPSAQMYRSGILRQRVIEHRLPGMTVPSERAYFKWHAQECFAGEGEAVDLGSWLGSTTAVLAMGLEANPRPAVKRATLHAYDRFTWESWMDDYAEALRYGPYSPGASFLPEFERVTRRWQERIRVHEGDLLEERWSGGPIELLLVDAMKSWPLAQHIVEHFYPALLPGQGFVIHQDFGHCFTPWIHLVSYRLRDALVMTQDVPRSETAVFRAARPVEISDPSAFRREAFDDQEVDEAFEYCLSITGDEKHSGIRAARVMLDVYDRRLDEAEERVGRLRSQGLVGPYHADAVTGALKDARRGTLTA